VEQQVEELQEQNSTEDDPTIEEDELADEEIDEEIAHLLAAELSAPPHAHTCINNEHDYAQQSCPPNNEDSAVVIHLPETRSFNSFMGQRFIEDIVILVTIDCVRSLKGGDCSHILAAKRNAGLPIIQPKPNMEKLREASKLEKNIKKSGTKKPNVLDKETPTNSTKIVQTKLVKKPTKVTQCRTPLANILNISDDDF
ncbi:unnamed protein product, partial [Didymodactylos carnosus]